MFGLEGDKKKKVPAEEFLFDLEQELIDPKKLKDKLELVQSRIFKLKEMLNKGVEKGEMNQFSILLHGYAALSKVITRKPKKKLK